MTDNGFLHKLLIIGFNISFPFYKLKSLYYLE